MIKMLGDISVINVLLVSKTSKTLEILCRQMGRCRYVERKVLNFIVISFNVELRISNSEMM